MSNITEKIKLEIRKRIENHEKVLRDHLDFKGKLERDLHKCKFKINKTQRLINIAKEELDEVSEYERRKSKNIE